MKKILLVLLLALGVAYVSWEKPSVEEQVVAQQRPEVGYLAPHFTLTGMDNQSYQLAGKREKPLVLNFWASWCGPCRMEAPDLKKAYEKYGQQVDFYAVNVTRDDTPDAAKAFVEQYAFTFPIPMDTKGEVASRYLLQAFPTTYLIDKNGVIRQKVIGVIDPAFLDRELRNLLAEKP